jgi:hypothetical protein
MIPLNINLAVPKKKSRQMVLGFVVVLIFAAATLTTVNLQEYTANKNVLGVSENWFKENTKKREQNKRLAQKSVPDLKKFENLKKDFIYINSIINKNTFSLPLFLSELEKLKPERVDINEVRFGENPKVVTIKGRSNFVPAVSSFFNALDKSPQFRVELLKEEIHGQGKIAFELTLEWLGGQDEKKI